MQCTFFSSQKYSNSSFSCLLLQCTKSIIRVQLVVVSIIWTSFLQLISSHHQVRQTVVPHSLPADGEPAVAPVLAGVAGPGDALRPPHEPHLLPRSQTGPWHLVPGRPGLPLPGWGLCSGADGPRNISTAVSWHLKFLCRCHETRFGLILCKA